MPNQKQKRKIRMQHRLATKCGQCASEHGEPNLQGPGTVNLQRCTGCQTVHYCSTVCQRGHWDRHRVFCQLTRRFKQDTAKFRGCDQVAEPVSIQAINAFLIGTDAAQKRAYFAIGMASEDKCYARTMAYYDFSGKYEISGRSKGSLQLVARLRGLDDPDLEGETVFVEHAMQSDGKYLATLFVKLPEYDIVEDQAVFKSDDPVKISFVLCSIDEKCMNNLTFVYKATVAHQRAPYLLWKYKKYCNQLKHTDLGWIWHGGGGQLFVLNPVWDDGWRVPTSAQLFELMDPLSDPDTSLEDENPENDDKPQHTTQQTNENEHGETKLEDSQDQEQKSANLECKENGQNEETEVPIESLTIEENGNEIENKEQNEDETVSKEGESKSRAEEDFGGERTDLTFLGEVIIKPFTEVNGEKYNLPPNNEGYRLARIGRKFIVMPASDTEILLYSFEKEAWFNLEPRYVPGDALQPRDCILYADDNFYVHRQYELCRCIVFKLKFNEDYFGLEPVANVDMTTQMHVFECVRNDTSVEAPPPYQVGDGGSSTLFLPVFPIKPPLEMHADVKYFAVNVEEKKK